VSNKDASEAQWDNATGSGLPLEQWLERVFSRAKDDQYLIDYQFPTERHANEYLASVHQRTDDRVTELLRKFLFDSCCFPLTDQMRLAFLRSYARDPKKFKGAGKVRFAPLDRMLRLESTRRLLRSAKTNGAVPAWDGIRWVIDLLPNFPRDALDAVYAYVLAHGQLLPDGRLQGLSDATAIIRARFISAVPGDAVCALESLSSREFEHVIEQLYEALGYETVLTKATRDGGRDVIAKRTAAGTREKVLIDCKLFKKSTVGAAQVMQLLGVVTKEPACRGVIVTTGHVTAPSRTSDPRVEVVDRSQLIELLNENFGANWPLRVDRIVNASRQKYQNFSNSHATGGSPRSARLSRKGAKRGNT
jgi:restriction system protein